jgi:hypothetical protein
MGSAVYTIISPLPSGTSNYHMVFLLQSTSSSAEYNANLALFAKHLKPGDTLFISGNPNSDVSTVLKKTQAAKAIVSPGVNVYSLKFYFNISHLIGNATKLPKGLDYIGYDYEKGAQYSPEFTTNEATSIGYFDAAQAAVKQYNDMTQSNAKLIVTPPYGELKSANWDWGQAAKHMGAIDMQTQAFLTAPNYGNIVTSLVSQIRHESPGTHLFIQTSIMPARGTAQDNANAINTIKTMPIDGILVFYGNTQTLDLQQLFTLLGR